MGVFGAVVDIDPVISTASFTLIIMFLLIIEAIWKFCGYLAKKNEYDLLFEKLSNEMLVMGLVSFLTYLFFDESRFKRKETLEGKWYSGFHVAHVVFFFIAISFVGKAFFFISSINLYGKRLTQLEFQSPVEIINDYNQLKNSSQKSCLCIPSSYTYFCNTSVWIQFFLQPKYDLAMVMQIQLLSQYFKRVHRLSNSIIFTNYVNASNRHFVMEFGEVAPITWILLAILILVNYIKIYAFDDMVSSFVCEYFQNNNSKSKHCWEYSVASIVGYGILLSLLMIGMLFVTMLSMNRLFEHVLLDIPASSQQSSSHIHDNTITKLDGMFVLRKYLSMLGKEIDSNGSIINSQSNVNLHVLAYATRMSFMHHSRTISRKSSVEQEDDEPIGMFSFAYSTVLKYVTGRYAVNEEYDQETNLSDVYLFGSPKLYFYTIELVLLIQSVYMSLVATQFCIIIARNTLNHPGYGLLWSLLIISPLFLSFYCVHYILFYASLLKCISLPDFTLCQNLLLETEKRHKLRYILRKRILFYLNQYRNLIDDSNYDGKEWEFRSQLLQIFKESVGDSAVMVRRSFRRMLHKMNIGVHDKDQIQHVFHSVDLNGSGEISWDELALVVFPFRRQSEYQDWEEEHQRSAQEMSLLKNGEKTEKSWFARFCCSAPPTIGTPNSRQSIRRDSHMDVYKLRTLSAEQLAVDEQDSPNSGGIHSNGIYRMHSPSRPSELDLSDDVMFNIRDDLEDGKANDV